MNFKRSCNRDPGEVVCEDFSINCATEIREGISEMTRLVADSTPGRDLFFHCKRQIHRLTTTFKLEHNSIAGHTATLPPLFEFPTFLRNRNHIACESHGQMQGSWCFTPAAKQLSD